MDWACLGLTNKVGLSITPPAAGALLFVRAGPTKRLRRTFAENLAIFDREAPKFREPEVGRDFGNRDELPSSREQSSSDLGQAQHAQMARRRPPVDFVEQLAKGSFAYTKRTRESRHLERLVIVGES